MEENIFAGLEKILREQNRSEEDIQEIYRAYKFAEKLHDGQYRVSEEPYIIHPVEVAKILVDLKLDKDTIIVFDEESKVYARSKNIKSDYNNLVKKLMGNKHGPEKNLLRCKWNNDDSLVSCGSADKIVHIWDVNLGCIIKNIYGHNGIVNEVDFNSLEPNIISSVSNDNTSIIGYF